MYKGSRQVARLTALVIAIVTLTSLGYSLISGLPASSGYTARESILDPSEIKLNIDVVAPEGPKVFYNIAKITIPSEGRWVKFVVSESTLPGGNISIDAIVRLQGVIRDYTINMPCASYEGECIRLSTVVLGYDEPLYIEGGVYSVTVEVSWHHRESLSGVARLCLTIEEAT